MLRQPRRDAGDERGDQDVQGDLHWLWDGTVLTGAGSTTAFVVVTNGGSGYSPTPVITLTGGSGSGGSRSQGSGSGQGGSR